MSDINIKIENIKVQLNNLEKQFDNLIIQMKNNDSSNTGIQIYNLLIQLLNLAIQMINIGKQIPIFEIEKTNIQKQIENYGLQIQIFAFQMNNMNNVNNVGLQMNNMNNMGMQANNINNIGMQMNNMNNIGTQMSNINTMNNMVIPINNMNLMGMQMNNNYQINYMNKFYQNNIAILENEFKSCCEDLYLNHIIGSKFELINNDIFNWQVTIQGPIHTPYEEGFFTFKVSFSHEFPKYGAEIKFINKIYHINVGDPNDPGRICYPPLNEWKATGKVRRRPNYNIKEALYDILVLFYEPHDCVHNEEIGKIYRDKEKFNEECKKYVKLYASNPPASFKKRLYY